MDTVLARQGTRLELDTTDPTQAAAGGVPVKPSTQPPVPEVIDQATLEELGFKWIPATGGTVPPLAVEGDPAQTKPSEKQYVSRVSLGGGVFAGKTISVFRGTNYALNGEEKVIKDYEVRSS